MTVVHRICQDERNPSINTVIVLLVLILQGILATDANVLPPLIAFRRNAEQTRGRLQVLIFLFTVVFSALSFLPSFIGRKEPLPK
jgi:hypothetical protein